MASVSVGFLVNFPGKTLFFVVNVFFINFDLSHWLRHIATFVCQYGYLADSLTISRYIAFYLEQLKTDYDNFLLAYQAV